MRDRWAAVMERGLRATASRIALAACVLAGCLGFAVALPISAQDRVTNERGVLFLNIPSYEPYTPDTTDAPDAPDTPDLCMSLKPLEREEIQTRLPIDGVPRLAVVYAAFPADSLAALSAVCFGVRYSPGIKVHGQGLCRVVAFELPDSTWPASGTGNVAICNPPQVLAPGYMLPVYWFVLSARAPGYFELTPNPEPSLGGRFANAEALPYQESISAFGKIGAGLEGAAPEPGPRPQKGACCLDRCYTSYDTECEFYRGIYLGPGTECASFPCGPEALKGACCLPSGCEMLTLIDCAREGGTPMGEGTWCDQDPCPPTSPPERSDAERSNR